MNQMYATTYYYFDAGTPRGTTAKSGALSRSWFHGTRSVPRTISSSPHPPSFPGFPDIPRYGESTERTRKRPLPFSSGTGIQRAGLPEIRILIPAGNETRREAEIMKQAWEASIEADVVLEEIPAEGYYERLKEVDYTVATLTWIGDYADPLTFLQLWTSESNLNDARYADREFDRMITASMGEPDAERYRSLGKAEEYLLSGAVVMPVSYTPAFNCIDLTVVDGWYPNPLDIHPFRWIRFAEPELPPGIVRLRESSVPAARTCHRKAPSP
jgi:peptide/nickel transport system substrate-binding protein/oligopeptide transport system substrate-binding protein